MAWVDYLSWPLQVQRSFHDLAEGLERRGFSRREAEAAAWAVVRDRQLRPTAMGAHVA
jgi:hypothetical protein